MQFGEKLTDRQAADAVRGRLDWKYALGLELSDPGFHFSVLCEFRDRLLAGQAEHLLFETLLKLFQTRSWLKERSRQRTDSTHILAAVRKLNRVELVGETLYHALDVLAQVAPDWLKAQAQPEWFERYSQRPTSFRLPRTEAEQLALAEQMGRDGWHLLSQVWSAAAQSIYGLSLPSKRYAAFGYRTSIWRRIAFAGAMKPTVHPAARPSSHRMTTKPVSPASATPAGMATKYI
jgi:transposase